jgi:hypothetical protein
MKKEIAGFKFIVENGFASELPEMATTVSVPVVEEKKAPVVMSKKEELDIPEFMKNYKEKRGINHTPKSNVVHVDFGKQEEEDVVVDKVEQVLDGASKRIKKAMRPVLNYFFDMEEK